MSQNSYNIQQLNTTQMQHNQTHEHKHNHKVQTTQKHDTHKINIIIKYADTKPKHTKIPTTTTIHNTITK